MATRRPAVKRSADVLRALSKELESDWPAGVTVLTGNDLYHLDQAQRLLLDQIAPASDGHMNMTVFGQEPVGVGTLVGAARSIGMFSSRRVVLLHEISMLEGEPDALIKYSKSPPAESYLIIRAPELDLRRKLHKALIAAGRVLTFANPEQTDTGSAIRDAVSRAKRKGLELAPAAAAFLVEIAPGDLYRLESELDKLQAWRGGSDAGQITLDEAREIAAGSDVMSGWEVANAITCRDRSAAYAAVARLVAAGDEPLRILGGVAYRVRSMLQARALVDRGERWDRVISATRAWYFKDQLRTGMDRYSSAELLAFPSHLLAADRALKGSALDGGTILETLVEKLTGGEQR